MRFHELAPAELAAQLRGPGVYYRSGPFSVHLKSSLAELPPLLHRLYSEYPLLEDTRFADFHISLTSPRGLRHRWRPQVSFLLDDQSHFAPFPRRIFLALLEWGLNWCVFNRAHQYLMIHAGVVEKHGHTLIFPASPGSGKSTLSAAMAYRGWRLLSDEFALIRPHDLAVVPFPRLIPLKNESIPVIQQRVPAEALGPAFLGTRKGTVMHLRPPVESLHQGSEVAQPGQFIFPRYTADHPVEFTPLKKADTFMQVATNSFNYETIGAVGFETLSALVASCPGATLKYGDLDAAIAHLESLVPEPRSG